MSLSRYGCLLLFSVILSACQPFVENVPPVVEDTDGYPDQPFDVDHIPDAVPKDEVRTAAGNKSPYRVLGKTYHVTSAPEGYREEGIASWYGTKFHGRRTSNGEIYNMYGMTAAHRSLPIPSYVRVTNKRNKRSVVVRVNDRGPFHGNRIIDLTYSAAKKLGYVNQGTAPVIVEYIDPTAEETVSESVVQETIKNGPPSKNKAPAPKDSAGYTLPGNTYLQVGAFSVPTSAESLKKQLKTLMGVDVWVVPPSTGEDQALYKVQIGPFTDNYQMMLVRKKLLEEKFPTPHVVYR